ncbi:MAG: c-type cytochrome [Deltaproteobacteria bacterium]|nr:c-type cytochrome [Deltaproteobacteria bacterium]
MKHIQLILLAPLFLLASCDYGRMWETPAVRPHEEEIFVMPEGSVPFDGGEEIWIATPAGDLKSPLKQDDPVNIGQGKPLYFNYCAQCHGRDFDGNGTVGQSFSPLPTDLRTVKVQSLSEGAMFKEISYGVSGGRQPPLASTIDINDRWRIIAYVKTLGFAQK